MSQQFDPTTAPPQNPYGSPTPSGAAAPSKASSFPVFCLVVFIIALLLCLFRGLILIFSVIGAMTINADNPMAPTVWGEVATGALTFLGGVIGYGAMLAKQRWGSYFAWASLLGVAGSIIVGLFQVPLMLGNQAVPEQTATMVGMWIGVGVVAFIRISISILCAVAIVRFVRWHREQQAAF